MEDEEIQTKNTTIMANTADNRPQLLSVNEEDEEVNVSKPELKGTDVKKRNHNGETNFRDLTETTDFSSDLSCSFDVPVEYALHPFELAEKSQGKLGLCKPKNNKARLEQTALAQTQYQNQNQQKRPDDALSSVLLPFSASQGSNVTSMCSPALNRSKSFSSKPLSIVPLSKIPPHDGYNWRKYGQKQVKIPQGSRSYYRCTYSDCYAKKIECSDNTSRVMEIVYRSHHNHDPPQTQKPSSIRRSKSALVSPVKDLLTHEVGPTDDSVQSISSNKPVIEAVPAIDFIEPPEPSGSDEHPETDVMPEHVKETDPQKTLKRNASSYTESLTKPGKRSKHIVHTSGDVYISGDGYRWRKYGQKMVKGNPHPRNYYRCTSAGCPVRKHIERAKDNTEAFVITYKGKHDHEMTIQKKCEGGLITPQVVAGDDGSPPVTKSLEQVSGEKTVESAKTLSSIGVEIETPPSQS